MIDIITASERNLKNIRQIGTPSDEDRIYIENAAYERIHEEDYADKRVFIFMGHTECEQSRYTTFIEAAIPVRDIDFVQNVPKWCNHAWSDVFREIKRSYEDSIIVGWAMDLKGFSPRMSAELETVHREQFGGAHQVLFLMDSIEGEEYFYINKGNRLQQRSGYYIYFCPKLQELRRTDVTVEMPEEDKEHTVPVKRQKGLGESRVKVLPASVAPKTVPEEKTASKETDGKSADREAHQATAKEEKRSEKKASSYAMAAAIALLLSIVGVGVYQDRIHLPGLEQVISTMGFHVEKDKDDSKDAEVLVGTQFDERMDETENTQDEVTETLHLIPVNELPSGEIRTVEEAQEEAPEADTEETAEKVTEGTEEETGEVMEEAAEDTSEELPEGDNEESVSADVPKEYIVQLGDTLTGICKRIYGSTKPMDEVVKLNKLESPDDIHEGQKLLLP